MGSVYRVEDKRVGEEQEHEKFLDLWKDADPGLSELREARNRLAELKR